MIKPLNLALIGFELLVNIDKLNIKDHYFAIKLVLNYEHSIEKEEILKML